VAGLRAVKDRQRLFAVEATRRWSGDGITANAVHPGAIADTNLGRHIDPAELAALQTSAQFALKTIAQGAATTLLVATSPQLEGVGGRYFEDCNEAVAIDPLVTDDLSHGVANHALDAMNAERLWDISDRLIRPAIAHAL
jgi:NAD(P)-dependent dehydrogenase (short-subunit alcohol dehydrogenase family)